MSDGPAAGPVALSVVAPVFNEVAILDELIERCARAAGEVTGRFEVILVDDASDDETPRALAARGPDPRVRVVRMPTNVGQFRATLEGLRQAAGDVVVVLDGDLQDPPEEIPRLVAALRAAPARVEAACAVKTGRDDPAWLRAGAAALHALQATLGRGEMPPGAGSFCALRRGAAARVTRVTAQRANLAAALASVGVVAVAVPYLKRARYDGRSRVGAAGLVREALGSLALTGALPRLLALGGGLAAAALLRRASRRR